MSRKVAKLKRLTTLVVSISESNRRRHHSHTHVLVFLRRRRTFINQALTAIELKSHLFISITAIFILFWFNFTAFACQTKKKKKREYVNAVNGNVTFHQKTTLLEYIWSAVFRCRCRMWTVNVWSGCVGVLVIHIKSVWIKWANDDGGADRFS